ncbi:MAG TPA: SCO family protein [Gammaproteobacteria bacterium]|nr:SCO family protein [Gammaproteobacteria bacterium]
MASDVNGGPGGNSLAVSRAKLLLVFALFAAPLVVAWIFHANPQWVPKAVTNHGVLVRPARPLDTSGLLRPGGTSLPASYLRGKWTLLYIGGAHCRQVCRRKLYDTRQIRTATGNNRQRVQRLYVRTGRPGPDALRRLARDHPDLTVAVTRHGSPFLAQFRFGRDDDPSSAHRLYIVDPHGNLMMRYPKAAGPGGMLKDLQHLLRVSQIG